MVSQLQYQVQSFVNELESIYNGDEWKFRIFVLKLLLKTIEKLDDIIYLNNGRYKE